MGKWSKWITAIVGGSIGSYLLHLPLRLLEDWLMGEIEGKIAENFQNILGFFIAWVLPIVVVFGAMYLGYRLKNPKSNSKNKKTQSVQENNKKILDSNMSVSTSNSYEVIHKCSQCGWGFRAFKYNQHVTCPKCGNVEANY